MANLFARLSMVLPPIGPTIGAAWTSVRSVLPDSCRDGQKQRDEELHFAKFGRKMNDTELSSLNNGTEGGGGMQRIDSVGDDDDGGGGEFGNSKHKISEWQAGWNVTNAIQVSFCCSFLSRIRDEYFHLIVQLGF